VKEPTPARWTSPPSLEAAEVEMEDARLDFYQILPSENPACYCGGRYEYDYHTYYRCNGCNRWWDRGW
jgi:tRNA(Ile2) C34 agmatinyltransferase TiaS